MTEQTDAAEVEALRADLANAECACGHQAEWHSALLGCNAEDWDQPACDCRGDWLDAVLPLFAAREAAARAEALRAAAEDCHDEARWCEEQEMRGKPQNAVDRVLVLEKVFRQRSRAIARTDGAGS